jgi:4-amino-4-deoxy-L-arabinose transferase-like glycosyltransferase
MGILAVVDTFHVYKIAELRYNRNVEVIASVLFAVMPSLLYNRWILLDSILMPLLLSSILFALYHYRKDSSKPWLSHFSEVLLPKAQLYLFMMSYGSFLIRCSCHRME